MSDSSVGCNIGCLPLVLGIIAIWAICFGVTINGRHYGMKGCSVEHGVEVDR